MEIVATSIVAFNCLNNNDATFDYSCQHYKQCAWYKELYNTNCVLSDWYSLFILMKFRNMNIKIIFRIKYLVTILALMRKTVWKMNTFYVLHEIALLVILLPTKCAWKRCTIIIVHFGDVVLQVYIRTTIS